MPWPNNHSPLASTRPRRPARRAVESCRGAPHKSRPQGGALPGIITATYAAAFSRASFLRSRPGRALLPFAPPVPLPATVAATLASLMDACTCHAAPALTNARRAALRRAVAPQRARHGAASHCCATRTVQHFRPQCFTPIRLKAPLTVEPSTNTSLLPTYARHACLRSSGPPAAFETLQR